VPRVGADVAGVEAADDDVEPALRLRLPDSGDIGEADSRFREGVDGDVAAMARQRNDDAVGAGLCDRWGSGVKAGGIGGGEGQRAQRLRIAQASGGDAAEVGEHMLAARR